MDDTENNEVCPACAGMIRTWASILAIGSCLPRMRGDDPDFRAIADWLDTFAPHARG